jgi:hypothetical protein
MMTDREILDAIKTIFIARMQIDLRFRGLNPKLLWKDIEKMISVRMLRSPAYNDRLLEIPNRVDRFRAVRVAAMSALPVDVGSIVRVFQEHYPDLSTSDGREIAGVLLDSITEALGGNASNRSVSAVDQSELNNPITIKKNLDAYLRIFENVKNNWRRIINTAKLYAEKGNPSFAIQVDEKPTLLFGGTPDFAPFWRLNHTTGKIVFRPIRIFLGEWDSRGHAEDPLGFENDLYRSMKFALEAQNAWLLVYHLPVNEALLLTNAEDPAIAHAAKEKLKDDED